MILDEIGRGTSTYDGLAIAWAVVEAMHDQLKCRTLFATHYHELTRLAERLDSLSLHHVRAREWKGDLVLLHEVAEGAADRSYGIAVAKLAGLPPSVVARAKSVLAKLEAGRDATGGIAAGLDDLPLFASAEPEPARDTLADALAEIEPDSLTPRAALEALYRLKQLAAKQDSDERARTHRRSSARSSIAASLPTASPASVQASASRPTSPISSPRALASGRSEITRRLEDEPGRGRAAARATAFLTTRLFAWPMIAVAPRMRTASRSSASAAPAAARWRPTATST